MLGARLYAMHLVTVLYWIDTTLAFHKFLNEQEKQKY